MNCIFCSTKYKKNNPILLFEEDYYQQLEVEVEEDIYDYDVSSHKIIDVSILEQYIYCPHCNNLYQRVVEDYETFDGEDYNWLGGAEQIQAVIEAYKMDRPQDIKKYPVYIEDGRAIGIHELPEEEKQEVNTYQPCGFNDDDDLPY